MAEFTVPFMLSVGFLLGLGAGFVMHRSDFCMAGMFRDLFLFQSSLRLRNLLLMVVSCMVLFELGRQGGLFALYPYPLVRSPSLTNVIGGMLFGIGMVLAGGCVVGTLFKMGAGSVLSGITFVGLVVGSTLFAEIFPFWKRLTVATTFGDGKLTIPQILGISPFPLVLAIALVSGWYFYRCYRNGEWTRPTYVAGAVAPWQAALFLSLVSLISYAAIGMPLGITTCYSKMGGYLESSLWESHFQTLEFYRGFPLKYRQPVTGMQLVGGAGPRFDAIAMIQFPVVIGIFLGGTLSAALVKELRFQVRLPWRQYLSAAVGGVVMGLASRMAPGCNIWHLMGGVPILSVQSLLFLVGLLPGAWLGSVALSRLVI